MALEGLAPMFDPETRLFCYRRKRTPAGLVREGVSHRYTIMVLLGLLRCQAAGMRVPMDIAPIVARLLENLDWVAGIGDLGLLLWLCGETSSRHLTQLRSSVDLSNAVLRFPDAREGKTTELAWFLAGLAHAALAAPGERLELKGIASRIYELVASKQGPQGIFGHLARRATLAGTLRSHIGCFADQVYPIYAMARYAEAFDDEMALQNAIRCADAICRLQGPLGQWWWHYDSMDGHLLGKYPVFSVHQHAMAPMALLVLGDVTRHDWTAPVYKGLQWISGSNELGCDLRDTSGNVIWRDIQPGQDYTRYLASALAACGWRGSSGRTRNLRINFECRPYEFGWLLYAFAGRSSPAVMPDVERHCESSPKTMKATQSSGTLLNSAATDPAPRNRLNA